MTFEEWLESDEGVLLLGVDPDPEWIDVARRVWNAAIEAAAAKVHCDLAAYGCGTADKIEADIRALSSNADLTGERGE